MTETDKPLPPPIVQNEPDESQTQAIVVVDSRSVDYVLREYAEGQVKVFGEPLVNGRGVTNPVTRTEITLADANAKVLVHRNFKYAPNMFASPPHFNEVEVRVGNQTRIFTIAIDPKTSPYNPVYQFADETGEVIGTGQGEDMDLSLAASFLRTPIGVDPMSTVAYEVVSHLQGTIAQMGKPLT